MSDASSGHSRSRSTLRSLRLPLLGVLGALSMGSGGGNPGCDSPPSCGGTDESEPTPTPYTPPVCDASCDAIAGRYRVTFQDTSPLSAGCQEIGLTLPDELILSRKGDELATQLQGLALDGPYYKAPTHEIYLTGEDTVALASGKQHPIRISIAGTLVKIPATALEPATITGSYYAFRVGNAAEPAGTPECSIDRKFSASR